MNHSASSTILLFTSFLAFMLNAPCAMADVYCATGCESDDPCGDGKGQNTECTDLELTTIDDFGYTNIAEVPSSFLGCSKAKCEEVCSGVDMSLDMTVMDGFLCFPEKSMMDGMFPKEDYALMSAVSRGCSGSHEMKMNGMVVYMHGDMHGDCADSFSDVGVTFSGAFRLYSPFSISLISSLLVMVFVP